MADLSESDLPFKVDVVFWGDFTPEFQQAIEKDLEAIYIDKIHKQFNFYYNICVRLCVFLSTNMKKRENILS